MLKFVYSEEATKFCEICTLLLCTVHTDKSKVKISQNFVAFSEYTNFKCYFKKVFVSLWPFRRRNKFWILSKGSPHRTLYSKPRKMQKSKESNYIVWLFPTMVRYHALCVSRYIDLLLFVCNIFFEEKYTVW